MAETGKADVNAKVIENPGAGKGPEPGPGPGPEAAHPSVTPAAPYDKETIKAIENFFQKRKKLPGLYTFDKNGNLEIKEGKGSKAPGTIQLRRFVPLEPSDRAAVEEARTAALVALDEEYEAEVLTLTAAWEEYRATESIRPVMASNQRLTDIDARRNMVRSAVRNLVSITNPVTKDVLFSEKYEERKMFENKDPFEKALVRLCLYTFPAEVDQGKYIVDEEEGAAAPPPKDEAAANEILYRQKLKDGRPARIFYDTDSDVNGFLSPMWSVDFTANLSGSDLRYSSPTQAYETERAKELGNDPLSETIFKTRSPRTIRLLVRKLQGHPKDAKGLWVKIYTAVYEQHPILKARLLDTGSDALVYADVREGPSSIGLGEKDSAALDPARWKGENAVGLAQETVRTRVREGSQEEAPAAAAKGGSITEEEQQKAKVAAIINARRRH